MPPAAIYIDNKLFLGRIEEQKQFRAVLTEILHPPSDEDLPYILLLYGDGGMGKTTLARRFCDIARDELAFEREFQIQWIDWEDERRRTARLQVGREHVSPETVFDVIHANAVKQNWGRHFGAYQEAVKKRSEAEKKAAAVLEASSERDELAPLRGVGAGAIAKVLRMGLPIGGTGEKLAQVFLEAGIKVGAEQAAQLRAALETRLRARLDPKQFYLFLNPYEQFARALAEGMKKVAASKPLLVCLDTYEIVDHADIWLRETMRAAGTRVVWIVSGRDNLTRSGQLGSEYFKGYADEFPRRLLAWNMLQLAEQDIRAMFADRAPKRALEEAEIQALSRATRGVPLAIDEAAEMWGRNVALEDILGDLDEATPRTQIVQKMTARYLLHMVAETDKQAFFALALARGDIDVLRAMLRPAEAMPFDLDALLHRLERDYASVHYDRARLHDDPAFFLRQYLRDEKLRTEDRVKILNQRAADALRTRLEKNKADLPRLEDRCEDDDWVKSVLDLCEYLFWLDESEAWHWLVPRYVEGLAYSRELLHGLAQTVTNWKDYLSKGGKKRLKVLRVTEDWFSSPDGQAELLDEFTHLQDGGWLKGEGESERGAILDWRRGMLLYQRKKYPEALAQYERAERALPEKGEALKKQLGESLYTIAGKFLWPQDTSDAVYSTDAERILLKVVAWLPEKIGAWYELGVALSRGGKLLDAIPAYQRAIELDPKDAHAPYALGITYRNVGQYDAALTTYQRAIELNPKVASLHNGMGNIYLNLGQFDTALAAYQRSIELDPKDALSNVSLAGCYRKLGRESEAAEQIKIARDLIVKESEYNRACFESICGNVEEAIALLKVALKKNPGFCNSARHDPDFDFVRDDTRFVALVGNDSE